ncbi:MAG: (deoxy)nucleoside triphosphate pyrophosphohydrolase [Flavobacterium sp.]|nr:MAG: (deoxy)nucleoside triphosphate pyrophosphohydrolase [Flavobacterium sp.]
MINVIAGIIYNNDKILVARRASHKQLGGFWEFPGGKLEASETHETCVIRELKEEMNIDISVNKYLMFNEHEYSGFSIRLHAYLCTFISGQLKLTDHDQVDWVDVSELSRINFAPADIPIVSKLIEANKKK